MKGLVEIIIMVSVLRVLVLPGYWLFSGIGALYPPIRTVYIICLCVSNREWLIVLPWVKTLKNRFETSGYGVDL